MTVFDRPIENEFQLTTAFCEFWVIVRALLAGVPTVALPPATVPPCGRMLCARSGDALLSISATASGRQAVEFNR
jgi:hypothetical protein